MGIREPYTRRQGGLALALLFALGLGGAVPLAQATTDSFQIVPPIAEAAPSTTARGMFYQQTLDARLPAGPALLASSPDGLGWLCTDDQATLRFTADSRTALTWSHRFASADRRAIACLPPQQLELPVAAQYQITVTLEDLYPNTSSSRPYYLVFAADAAPPVATALALPTSAQLRPPATAVVAVPIVPVVPTIAATGEPVATIAATPEPPTAQADAVPGQERRWLVLLLGLALLAALAAWMFWRSTRRPAAALLALTGILYLFDQETREAHTALVRGQQRLDIRRRPLCVAPLAAETGQGIAQIQPSSAGLLLYEPAADAAVPLLHDRLYTLAGGAVTLRYREPGGRRPAIDDRRPTTDDRLLKS